jgi:two-component system sensor histidine kinase YesM
MISFKHSKIKTKIIFAVITAGIISFIFAVVFAALVYWPKLSHDARIDAQDMSQAIATQINNQFEDMSQYSVFLLNSNNLHRALDIYHEKSSPSSIDGVENILKNTQTLKSNICITILEEIGKQKFYSNSNLAEEDSQLIESSWYNDLLSGQSSHNWSSFYTAHATDGERITILYIHLAEQNGHKYALTTIYRADDVLQNIQKLVRGTYSGYLLTDSHDSINSRSFWQEGTVGNADDIAKGVLNSDYTSCSDKYGYYFISSIPCSGWKMVGFIERSAFNSSFLTYFILSLLICFILSLLVIILVLITINQIIAPIGSLKNVMQQVMDGDISVRSDIRTNDEIGELSDMFNHMLEDIQYKTKQEIEWEKNTQRMKYNLLLGQIDTHFLYNTLSIINSFARKEEYNNIIFANSALTKILQHNLRGKELQINTSIQQEMEITDCYWSIMKMRPNNHVQLNWNVSPSLYECMIPQNLIQPLVENSLQHGLANPMSGEYNGTINISIYEETGQIVLCVTDNGCGISPEALNELNHPSKDTINNGDDSTHIGLINIRRRLLFLYGENVRMNISCENGTTVCISFPKI